MRAHHLDTHLVTLISAAVLALCILTPTSAHAQSKSNGSDQQADADPVPPPPPPVDAVERDENERATSPDPLDYKPELDETYDPTPNVRPGPIKVLTLEALGGIGGVLAGSFAGGLTGSVAGLSMGNPGGVETGLLVGGSIGYALGPALGVWATGNGLNGNGSFLATQAGSLLGAIGGGLLFYSAVNSSELGPGVTLAGMTVLPVLGSIIGYERSNTRPSKAPKASPRAARWSASVTPTRDGGSILVFGGRW